MSDANGSALTTRNYAWTDNNPVLFIDQPVGSGFSYTDKSGYANTESQITKQLLEALKQFFTIFVEFSNRDFYIAGQSYAGKFIPPLVVAIQESENVNFKVSGIMIGDGFTDPISTIQYSTLLYQVGEFITISKPCLSVISG